jgi:putative ABC transport system permease protein
VGLREIVRLALQTLAKNKMRTWLTMLGIIIGVGAVICTVAISVGASNQVQEQIRNLSENMLFVSAGSVNQGGVRMGSQATKTLTVDDAQAILQQVPLVMRISPIVSAGGQVVYQDQNWFTRFQGVSPDYLQIRRWPLQDGSNFSERDVDVAANLCVIGQTVAQNLFANDSAVGKVIRVRNIPFQVVGELAPKGNSPFGQDEDDTILIPYTTVQKKIAGIDWLQALMCSTTTPESMAPAQQQIAALLRQRHKLRPAEADDFIIRNPNDLANAQAQTGKVMTLLLASIASVSLVVGGIGIMNIMLVSVTERTREIGVRMAIGATEWDVQRQFLSEAVVLSVVGGAVGVLAGVLGSYGVSSMLGWPTQVPASAVAIAVIFSAAVGVFFGYYPARKAAHLNPIEALRYE